MKTDDPSSADIERTLEELRVYQLELEMQNTELRRAQVELDAVRARYFDLYDLAPVGYVTVNENGLIVEGNITAAALLSVSRGLFAGSPISRYIFKDDQDIYYLHRKKLIETAAPQSYEIRLVKPDGLCFWARLEMLGAKNIDGVIEYRIAMSDISASRRTSDALQKTLLENHTLLGELQHRAKNSFNLIVSMISLASTAESSAETAAVLTNLRMRVMAVSELYSLLYAAGSFAAVRLDHYCDKVVSLIAAVSGKIVLRKEMENIEVSLDQAVPVGLILTELITNAFKYAFPDGRAGTISILLRKTAAGASLEVEDDGVGLPEGFEISDKKGMGLYLVHLLADQVHGALTLLKKPIGTRCALEFPIAGPHC